MAAVVLHNLNSNIRKLLPIQYPVIHFLQLKSLIVSGKQEINLTKSLGLGARSSLLPGGGINSISKAAGVSHLSEK